MQVKQSILTLAVVLFGIAKAAPKADSSAPGYGPPPIEHDHKGMPYEFGYRVDDELTANHFGHNEASDGNVVTGEYRVLLPDGRTQIVRYRADHNSGFVADVSYEGEAILIPLPPPGPSYLPTPVGPTPAPIPRPSYLPPSPTPRPPPPPPRPTPTYAPAPVGDAYAAGSSTRTGTVLAPPQPSEISEQLTADEEEFIEYYI